MGSGEIEPSNDTDFQIAGWESEGGAPARSADEQTDVQRTMDLHTRLVIEEMRRTRRNQFDQKNNSGDISNNMGD